VLFTSINVVISVCGKVGLCWVCVILVFFLFFFLDLSC
jgi:hypothetical protein